MALQLRWTLNRFVADLSSNKELALFRDEAIRPILKFQQSHPAYQSTPLVSLDALSSHLGVGSITVKDESKRFGLNAFKALGALHAIGRVIADLRGLDADTVTIQDLLSEETRNVLGDAAFISATDGNHGRGVAWAARELGQHAVIYLPKGSSESRRQAIEDEGAEAYITDLNYDDTVRMCAVLAVENGWTLVQDTAFEGYEKIPLWIMQGYAAIIEEILQQQPGIRGNPPTHVILQAGVGSFAAAIAVTLLSRFPENPPKIILVEPAAADCYFRSFTTHDGHIEHVTGDLTTIMAGLSCGEPNPVAYQLLKQLAFASFSVPDPLAALGMRMLGNPLPGDERIVSGESGAIPIGLLAYLRTTPEAQEICQALSIEEDSRILCINTEGDTDPAHYLDVVWRGYHSNLPDYSEIIT